MEIEIGMSLSLFSENNLEVPQCQWADTCLTNSTPAGAGRPPESPQKLRGSWCFHSSHVGQGLTGFLPMVLNQTWGKNRRQWHRNVPFLSMQVGVSGGGDSRPRLLPPPKLLVKFSHGNVLFGLYGFFRKL